jgi:hypothetical protein
MSDISKCSGLNCPLKEDCYRYTAPKSEWQSYLTDVPYDSDSIEEIKCVYFWNNWQIKELKNGN